MTGTCANIANGQDPDNDCAASNAATCGNDRVQWKRRVPRLARRHRMRRRVVLVRHGDGSQDVQRQRRVQRRRLHGELFTLRLRFDDLQNELR